jgi:hypothetical protein
MRLILPFIIATSSIIIGVSSSAGGAIIIENVIRYMNDNRYNGAVAESIRHHNSVDIPYLPNPTILYAAINRDKMDWAQLPFNSEAKAAQEDAFVAGRLDNVYREPKSGTFFKNIMGDGLFPPNTDEREQNERRILNSYKAPQVAKNEEEEETSMIGRLVKKLFASDKDYEPVVEKSGDNKWDITELRPKARKEQWADADKGTSIDSAVRAGWIPPTPSMQIFDQGTNDPYFAKHGVADQDNGRFYRYQDFSLWSKDLSRMFAPSLPTRDWT